MVEAFNTLVADGTVAGAGRAQDEAVRTHLTGMNLCEQVQKVVRAVEIPGVAGGGYEKAEGDDWAEDGNGVGKNGVSLLCK